jgi:hypothetical protein
VTRKIKLNREWGCSPLGGAAVSFAPGTYSVPEQMSDFLADRCLRSGRGQLVNDEQEPQRQKSKGRAPENKLRAS